MATYRESDKLCQLLSNFANIKGYMFFAWVFISYCDSYLVAYIGESRGDRGPYTLGKSQFAICFLITIHMDPLEKQLDPSGPIAS